MKTIQLGDRVSLIDMEIVDLKEEMFACQFKTNSVPQYYMVPIYLSGLDIRFKENSFCKPGGSVNPSHPDYYKYQRKDQGKAVYVDRSGLPIRIELDEEFNLNGKYYLRYFSESIIDRIAQLMTEDEWLAAVEGWIGMEVDFGVIVGTVIRIFMKEYDTYSREITDIIYMKTSDDAYFYTASEDEVFVVIHDEGGDMEYTVPLDLINKL